MINLNQALQNYSNRKELTVDEKTIVIKAYGNCKELNLVNFVDKLVVDEIERMNINIPQKLIYAFVNEIETRKTA